MKIWCISDTHGKHEGLKIPENIDMIICSGDIGTTRDPYQSEQIIRNFLAWYDMIPNVKYKLLCGGNHDIALENGFINKTQIPKSITYGEHETIEIGGLKVFLSPYTPSFGTGWAFNVKRNKLDEYWKEIPDGTDIVITHGPPQGILDHTECGAPKSSPEEARWENKVVVSCGDKSLLNHIQRVKPLVHCFGHIHNEDRCQNAGITQIQGLRTKFINASVVDLDYKICNNGFIIEI